MTGTDNSTGNSGETPQVILHDMWLNDSTAIYTPCQEVKPESIAFSGYEDYEIPIYSTVPLIGGSLRLI